ncbi:MAG: hypothetical protein JWN56_46 [Sphingobacteriales bacterium]|nr:hypothetical protein [Sphingobacteriales bacterium]
MFGLFKKKLPDCDELFVKYLARWYPEEERPKMTRPDMYIISGYEGKSLDLSSLQYLPDKLLEQTKEQIRTMAGAALADYQEIIKSDLLDFNVLDAVDKFYDRPKIAEIIKESDPKDYFNLYFVTVCEFGATLGYLYNELEGYDWLYSFPYYHSIIVHRDTGFGITVFDWAVKKFSEYGVDDGYVAKFHAAMNGINEHQEKKNGL